MWATFLILALIAAIFGAKEVAGGLIGLATAALIGGFVIALVGMML